MLFFGWQVLALLTMKTLDFYGDAAALPRLKKAALCFRLTSLTVALSAQESEKHAEREPAVVRLGKKEVQTSCFGEFCRTLEFARNDPQLDLTDVVPALLTTLGHIIVRFEDYCQWPFCLWKLTRKYNADGCVLEAESFLELSPDLLDLGYSAPLQRSALAAGSIADGITLLLSDAVQHEVEALIRAVSTTSLDVERKHAQDKRQEKNRVVSVSAASRNGITQRYRVTRNSVIRRQIATRAYWKRKRTVSAGSLAAQRNPSLLPRPGGFMGPEHVYAGDPCISAVFGIQQRG